MHANGITIGNEPGGILAKPVQDGINTVFSSPDMRFRWSFMPDAKTLVSNYPDDAQVIAETEKLESWYGGMTSLAPKQAKLFADGGIYSLLMQVREPYLDGHTGEWMMDKGVFERAFRIYWDAGYQIHVHVNGDAGLDRVLDTLEANLRRNPRYDHRTVLVHFAVSAEEQVQRISDLDDSPLAVEPMKIRDVAVWGTVMEGRVFPVAEPERKASLMPPTDGAGVKDGDYSRAAFEHALKVVHSHL